MVNITFDGNKYEVPEGLTVLQAARKVGVQIPVLCDHPHLTPYGGCRLCLVEVEGARTLQPSCTLPAGNNMVVRTNTDKVHEARKFVLSLLFSERNHFCMYCQVSGGDCVLQNEAYCEGMTHWPLSPNYQPYPVDASHPYFVLDHNRCILCRRCVRACGELAGIFTLGFEERGAHSFLVADFGAPLGQSSCVSCGSCIQVCPTGALIDRESAYRGRDTQVEHTDTICTGCSLGCGIEVLFRDNHLVRIDGDWDAAINKGVLCKTGRFEPLADERQRILTPLVRKNGTLKAATWDEALDTVAGQLKPLAGKNGDGIAALASTRLSLEALSAFKNLFVDVLGASLVTSSEEGAATSAAMTLAVELGKPFEGPLSALNAADVVAVIGADLVANHEVAGFMIKRAIPAGAHLITIEPDFLSAAQENSLTPQAKLALKPAKDSEVELLYGLAAAIVKLGLAKAQPSVDLSKYTLEATSQKTGVPAAEIEAAARLLASAAHPALVYGEGLTHKAGPAALKGLLELAHLAGALDEAHSDRTSRSNQTSRSAVISPKGGANSVTAALLGLEKPFEPAGYQAVFIAIGEETPSQRLVKLLENTPFLAVQAAYTSPLTVKADVVLPVEIWSEQEGTFISLDGSIQTAKKTITPAEGVRANLAAISDLAAHLGQTLDPESVNCLASKPAMVTLTGLPALAALPALADLPARH